ncbi:hypothetical protein V5799_026526 [Amblyomma americanum]|uniref:Uncharacterized protein n=1 Tax=Amblyomma americanum TaxID=6943 RepID=A0AAQ4DIB4_AMBAM
MTAGKHEAEASEIKNRKTSVSCQLYQEAVIHHLCKSSGLEAFLIFFVHLVRKHVPASHKSMAAQTRLATRLCSSDA